MKRMKVYSFLLIVMLAGSLAFTVKKSNTQPILGTAVADFSLADADGKMVSLASFTDAKGFVIVFMSNSCDVSKAYEGKLNQINKWYAKKGFPVIAINSGDTAKGKNSLDKSKQKSTGFTYLSDPSQSVAKQFQVENTPYAFLLVKEDGKYVSRYIGAIDGADTEGGSAQDKYLAAAVDAVLKGESPEHMVTIELGCPLYSDRK